MFLESFRDREREDIFDPGHHLILSRLSHSCDDPRWSYQYHLHSDETELVYIAGGEGTLSINTNTYSLKKGSILVVERGAIHSLTSDEVQPLDCWTCAISGYKLSVLPEAGFFLPPNVCPATEAGECEGVIKELFYELDHMRGFGSAPAFAICDLLAAALAAVYYEQYYASPQTELQQSGAYFVRDILTYLNENYASRITLHQLSQEFHISAAHISHEFTRVYGVSPINYVIARRMNEAAWLLLHTQDTLVSIARQVGYDNASHFAKLFCKRMGLPPLEFREKYEKRWKPMER